MSVPDPRRLSDVLGELADRGKEPMSVSVLDKVDRKKLRTTPSSRPDASDT